MKITGTKIKMKDVPVTLHFYNSSVESTGHSAGASLISNKDKTIH